MSVPVAEALSLPLVQCAVRDNESVSFFQGPFDSEFAATRLENRNVESCTSNIAFNADGSLYAVGTKDCVLVKDANTHEVKVTLPASQVKYVYFSPKSSYLVTLTLFDSHSPENLLIWNLSTGELDVKFFQKSSDFSYHTCQWTSDEKHFCHAVSNEIQIFSGNAIKNFLARIHVESINTFAVSPLQKDGSTSCVAVFCPPKKGKPGRVSIYDLTKVVAKIDRASASKSFFKATDATLKWNSLGTAVLCWTTNESGDHGDSYYGESFLYLITADGSFECVVPFENNKNPIHDVCWAPRTYDFITLQGEARSAKAIVWAAKDCRAVKELGAGPWNMIRFSPSGRFVALAGFGSLAGQIEVWEKSKLVRLAATQDIGSPSVFEWTPDGRHFMTATLYPRLRVGNQFKIYKYDGTLLFNEKAPSNMLQQLTFRPAAPAAYPDRPASPDIMERARKNASQPVSEVVAPGAPVRASYVPPHLRGKASTTSNDEMKALHQAALSGPRDIIKEKKQQQQQQQSQNRKLNQLIGSPTPNHNNGPNSSAKVNGGNATTKNSAPNGNRTQGQGQNAGQGKPTNNRK